MKASIDKVARCVHCEYRPIQRSRRLCYSCYRNYGIRNLYPFDETKATAKKHRLQEDLKLIDLLSTNPERYDPYSPTSHLPGTIGKILIFMQRAAMGIPLFHPLDKRLSQQ